MSRANHSGGRAAAAGSERLRRLRPLVPVALVTLAPLVLANRRLLAVLYGARPRSWDGSGHFAVAQIFDRTIFPDTFGWTHAYFGGMPLPNFYPPLFYWCVAALHHTHLLTFTAAFKLVLLLPVVLTPAAVWLLAWSLSGRDRAVAAAAGFGVVPLLVDYRFYRPIGLDYLSTFGIGLFTQPLGFVLLLAWIVAYCTFITRRHGLVAATVLHALTVLANVFNAATSAVFVAGVLAWDVVCLSRTTAGSARDDRKRELLRHAMSPLLAIGLGAFWLVPMANAYEYFVTRPFSVPLGEMVPPAMWGWYALAGVGALRWLRRPTAWVWPYLGGCLLLAGSVVLSEAVPGWLPFQATRFVATLNFLLALPAGFGIVGVFERVARATGERGRIDRLVVRGGARWREYFREAPVTSAAACVLIFLTAALIRVPFYTLSFLPTDDSEVVDHVLRFARDRRDGSYLVEGASIDHPQSALDGRAISAYLGAQGNESISVVFREASPSALFVKPLVNAFSASPDNFGLSSALGDDLDFAEQPLSRHIERARLFGVKYLVIATPEIKEKLAREAAVARRHDLGSWSVFELGSEILPRARVLAYRPALVVSGLTVKRRHRNDYGFVRFAEEQFASGWFDVLLAHAPVTKIDRLGELQHFGALVLDTYECDDEERAHDVLREFARERTLILLSSDAPLFRRLRASIAELPGAEIIERPAEDRGPAIGAEAATYRYDGTAVRRTWEAIRSVLDRSKVPANVPNDQLRCEIGRNSIHVVSSGELAEPVPVLVTTTYHPNWRLDGGSAVYTATPFFMLTFLKGEGRIRFERSRYDWAGASITLLAGIFVCVIGVWCRREDCAGVLPGYSARDIAAAGARR